MVTITNGDRTMTVSKGAFKALFEPIGWKLEGEIGIADTLDGSDDKIDETNVLPPIMPEEKHKYDEEDAEEPEEEEDEEVEVPISEMSVEQLKVYAKEQGIDISAARNKKELRQIVENSMED